MGRHHNFRGQTSEVVLLVSIPGLDFKLLQTLPSDSFLRRLAGREELLSIEPAFPAVTLPVQTSVRTGTLPSEHGIVSNGFYERRLRKVFFWEQSSHLISAPCVLSRLSETGISSALLFWQLSIGSGADYILSPAPVHKDDELVQAFYSKPPSLYEELCSELGPFELMDYWGPRAGLKGSKWIAEATALIIERFRPHLVFTYLPQLDYTLMRGGDATADLIELSNLLEKLVPLSDLCLILSEYSMTPTSSALLPNLLLRERGYLKVRQVEGMEYLLLPDSDAFAMVDHQLAHIYCNPELVAELRAFFRETEGIAEVLGKDEQERRRIAHPRSGELVVVSEPDRWFAYYWWEDESCAPHFARTVDIHQKPGFDPLELFWDDGIPLNTSLLRASHGRSDAEVPIIASKRLVEGGAPFRHPDLASLLLRYFLRSNRNL